MKHPRRRRRWWTKCGKLQLRRRRVVNLSHRPSTKKRPRRNSWPIQAALNPQQTQRSTPNSFTSTCRSSAAPRTVSPFLPRKHFAQVFYVPETNCGASDRIKALIRKHGGISTEYHECCTIQIKPTISDLQYDSFFPGDIYSEKWLAACVKANKIVKKEEFYVGNVPIGQGQRLNLSKRKKFTIMEGMTLYKILGKRRTANEQNTFWQRLVENNKLPERSWESLKKFWQVHENKTQEVFLCESIHNRVDFCLSFKEIPDKKQLEDRLRESHSEVFDGLEAADAERDDLGEPKAHEEALLTSASTGLGNITAQKSVNVEEFKVTQEIPLSLKPVEKIACQPYLITQLGKRRTYPTMDRLFEEQISQRHKTYIPKQVDLVDYDTYLFEKQMDMEVMRITWNPTTQKRDVTREPNELGCFRRLEMDLKKIATEYGRDIEEIYDLYQEVNCSKQQLR